MKKTYIAPAVRITEADVEAVMAATSSNPTSISISSTDEVGGTSSNGTTWSTSSKESSFDFDDEE